MIHGNRFIRFQAVSCLHTDGGSDFNSRSAGLPKTAFTHVNNLANQFKASLEHGHLES
jgi:hypothetical protein